MTFYTHFDDEPPPPVHPDNVEQVKRIKIAVRALRAMLWDDTSYLFGAREAYDTAMQEIVFTYLGRALPSDEEPVADDDELYYNAHHEVETMILATFMSEMFFPSPLKTVKDPPGSLSDPNG